MKKNFLKLIVVLLMFNVNAFAENSKKIKRIFEGKKDAKITIITYESLTCIHCANFHKDIYPQLKENFIDTGLVKIEFRHFPLDLAALNASKISQCQNDGSSKLTHILYSNQKKWAKGSSISEVNDHLKDILKKEDVVLDFDDCIADKDIENFVLNDRINGVKEYDINATPTIIINNKKFDKALNYKNLKESIEKLI